VINRIIVTTTINSPTKAIHKFCALPDWTLIVVGDQKTPHKEFEDLDCVYLSPAAQEKKYPELSQAIGWNCIQRRNIGFVEAYRLGADIVASVDDDNIPYKDWGTEVYVDQTIEVDLYDSEPDIFDPLSITNENHLWHRGYPLEFLSVRKNVKHIGVSKRKVLIQADLWDGDPDIDAIARLGYEPKVAFTGIDRPFASNKLSPFNSQNTFLSRRVIPHYMNYCGVGRCDDILGGYFVQLLFPQSLIYNKASVVQERNHHDIFTDLAQELYGYSNTMRLLSKWRQEFNKTDPVPTGMPEHSVDLYSLYRKHFV